MTCKYLKYGCIGASVVCRTATKDIVPGSPRGSCPNDDNPYIVTPFCWTIDA